jgi:nitrous oxidase accessory protein
VNPRCGGPETALARLLFGGALLAVACGRVAPLPAPPASAAPSSLAASEPLQARIDAAPAGAVLQLGPGEHRGPIRIGKPLTLQGPPDAVIRSAGEGCTVRVEADDVTLRGFTVSGSGQRFDLMDGGVRLHGARLCVEGLCIRAALFGILVEQSRDVTVRDNLVQGPGGSAMGLRGDGIRLWETTDSVVSGNRVADARDVVVWYSSRNRITGNTVIRCRYGAHFMYSHGNEVADNRFVDDVVGLFVMYSHDLHVSHNLLARAGGAAGIGLGLKESGNVLVEDNWFLANTTGIYVDRSPLDLSHQNRYLRNVLRLHETAVAFHASQQRSEFQDNEFRDNGAVVKVGAEGDALACTFRGNFYDTYQGYDLDGDGLGDLPFEFRRLSTQLESRAPELAFLHGAPAMHMVDLVGEVMPLFEPRRLLCDPSPRMRPLHPSWTPEADHAH